jgi:2-keto-3-deoxy-L-rhamnonate aldolase RhmA
VNGQKVYLRDVASFHTPDTQTHEAARALNSGLSGHGAPMVQSKNNAANAVNAYKGIYE